MTDASAAEAVVRVSLQEAFGAYVSFTLLDSTRCAFKAMAADGTMPKWEKE